MEKHQFFLDQSENEHILGLIISDKDNNIYENENYTKMKN